MSKVEFLSPVGRMVYGSPFKPITTNFDGTPKVVKNGPNKGQPTQTYEVGLAIAKNSPDLPAFWAAIVGTARAGFPNLFDAAGNCTHPQFSFKMMDGDGIDMQGKPNNQKEGYAGHFIFKFASSYLPRVFRAGRYAPQDMLTETHAGEIRRGYFYRVAGTMEGNGQAAKPGVYLNLGMLELVALGDEITSGPDATTVFGGAAAFNLPTGARALPSVPAASAIPGLPGAQAVMVMPGAQAVAVPVMQVAQPVALPGAQVMPAALPVTPNPAFAPGGVAVPGVGMPTMPVMQAAPVRQMTAKAGTFTYDQLKAGGWTDEALIAQGYMTA